MVADKLEVDSRLARVRSLEQEFRGQSVPLTEEEQQAFIELFRTIQRLPHTEVKWIWGLTLKQFAVVLLVLVGMMIIFFYSK